MNIETLLSLLLATGFVILMLSGALLFLSVRFVSVISAQNELHEELTIIKSKLEIKNVTAS